MELAQRESGSARFKNGSLELDFPEMKDPVG